MRSRALTICATLGVAAMLLGAPACEKSEDADDAGSSGSSGGSGNNSGTRIEEDAGFQGMTATIDGTPVSYTEQRAAYGSSFGELTTLRAFRLASPANVGESLVLTLDSESTGTFPCAVPGATLAWAKQDSLRYGALVSQGDSGTFAGSCTIKVDTYGEVGEFIEGTFEGVLERAVGAESAPAQATVKDGRFRLRRIADE